MVEIEKSESANGCLIFTARDFDCTQHLVAGVCQSDSIRGTALGKCFYPGIDVEQEQTELTEKNTWIRKAERRLPSTARW